MLVQYFVHENIKCASNILSLTSINFIRNHLTSRNSLQLFFQQTDAEEMKVSGAKTSIKQITTGVHIHQYLFMPSHPYPTSGSMACL